MRKKTLKKKNHNKRKRTRKQRIGIKGGNCGCNNNPLIIKGGNGMLNPHTLPSNTIPLNTFNNDPISLATSTRINGGNRKSKKYQKKQTPFYPRRKLQDGGDALLGSAYNPISSFGTTSGIHFSSNTLFGNTNQAPANGIADIPFFGKHNLPLV
jgi:hypothetical protein